MEKIFIVAKKEFTDLIRDPCIIFIIFAYIIIMLDRVDAVITLSANIGNPNFFGSMPNLMIGEYISILTFYGSIVALMIGFSSMSKERLNNSMSILITKPIFRDTIINGKLIGCLSFIACIFMLITSLYISSLLLVNGNLVVHSLPLFLENMPVILLISLIYVTIFLTFAILVSTIVRNQGVAVLLTIFIYILLTAVLPTVNFRGNMAILASTNSGNVLGWIGSVGSLVESEIDPTTSLDFIINNSLVGYSSNLSNSIGAISFEVLKLLVFIIVIVFLTYSFFNRRDLT